MEIEKLKPNNDFFSDKDHFSKKTSTPIKKNEFELNRDEKCVNHIFGITVTSKFGGRFVKGKFIKKDGTSRSFHGQLLTNTRTNKSLCFKDLAKKQIRSISMNSSHILISSGGLTYEVNAHG